MSGGTATGWQGTLRRLLTPTVLWRAGLLLALGAALYLRLHALHLYALEQDPAEYALAASQGYLPHSPYILYLWLGMAMDLVGPPDVGYSILSLVTDCAAVLLLAHLVLRVGGRTGVAWAAAAAYAVSPLAVGYGGLQEVYAPQSALILGALLLATRGGARAPLAAGLVYGAAFALHNASIYAAPVFALLLWRGARPAAPPRERALRLLRAAATAAILPALAYGWTATLFMDLEPERWASAWLRYLKGIAPRPDLAALTPARLADQAREHAAFVLQTVWSPPYRWIPAVALGLGALLALWRQRRALAVWLAFGLPFSAYETLLGRNVDPGVYVPFLLPAIAALTGVAVVAIARLLARAGGALAAVTGAPLASAGLWLGRLAAAGALYVLLFPAVMTANGIGDMILSRASFFDFPLTQAALFLRDTIPEDAYVVQPDDLPHQHLQQNVYLLPYYAERRPIVSYHGRKMIWMGGPWAPLNLDYFVDVTDRALHAMLASRIPIVGLEPEPFYTRSRIRPRRWRPHRMTLVVAGQRVEDTYYTLEFAGPPAGGRARAPRGGRGQ